MEIRLKTEEPIIEKNNLNFIPCSINFNGKAKVSSYFREKEEKDGVKYSSFRGRPLLGHDVKIPEGYSGYLLKKEPEDPDTDKKLFCIEQSFKTITNWNLDKIPSNNDLLVSAMDWFDISTALHSREKPNLDGGDTK